MTTTTELEAGRAALAKGDWEEARRRFEMALGEGENPHALEGLGWALWWLDHVTPSFEAREKAYRLFAERHDNVDAARVATFLALDIYDYQGQAVASGWFQRARRLLDASERSAVHGWHALWEGHFARMLRRDVETSRRLAAEAIQVAREFGIRDLELLGVALEGHALVSEGQVEEGMKKLDEATAAAMAGEISDLDAAGAACCFLMHACEQVRDYDRAAQWADRVAAFSKRWKIRPLYAICRVHHAAMLVGCGEWTAAERDLEGTLSELSGERGPARNEATLFLGDLRRRQGRHDEAAALFGEVEGMSLSLYGRAAMAFDEGDAQSAEALLERALRRVAEDNWTVRAAALDLLVRAQLAAGRTEQASAALETLQSIADLVRTDHVIACARHAAGILMFERGEHDAARHALEDAIDHYAGARAPYEANLVRLDLVGMMVAAGRTTAAAREAQTARAAFEKLGAARGAQTAAELATPAKEGKRAAANSSDGPLTPRELEVLTLVAEGLGDKEIAAKLHLSDHTIHRHVSNLMLKLDVTSRAAAVAQAVRRGLI